MSFIPELSDNIVIDKIESDDSYYIVHENYSGNRIKINSLTKHLIEIIDGEKSIEDITYKLNENEKEKLDSNYVQSILVNLQSYGIVKSENEIIKKRSYIFLKVTLIPQQLVNYISSYFTFLFIKKIYFLIIACLITITSIYLIFLSKSDVYNFINVRNLLLILPFTYFSKILHEFGHASALKKNGLTPGSIGFGFYLLIPVFFADVNNSWKLNQKNKMLINIGGMYFQLLFSFVLVVIFLITLNKWFLIISLFNTLSIFPNLNPFIRYDGYWILTDLLKINNLIKKAELKFLEVITWLKSTKNNSPLRSKTDYFLLTYFLINKAFVFIIISFVLFYKRNSLVDFPNILYSKIIAYQSNNSSISFTEIKDFTFDNFYSIIFYVLLLSFSKTIIKQLYYLLKFILLSSYNYIKSLVN